MFYTGDLQSGIAKAVQESRLVACFVTDDGEESKQWEEDFLQEENLKSSLSDQAIVLRLVAGSQEAGFLAAIYPLPKTPTLVIIQNRDLKEYITSGVTKAEFLRRLLVVFQPSAPVESPSASVPSSSDTQTTPMPATEASQTQSAATIRTLPTINPATAPITASVPTPESSLTPQEDPRVIAMLAERAARLGADKAKKEAAEKAQRTAEAKARKAALESEAPAGSSKSADMKYALQQKKRQQEARAERERILKRVEDDKAERREREAQRKAQAKAKEDAEKGLESSAPSSSVQGEGKGKGKATQCAIQVRLFDGSTIRSRFPPDGSLRANVRPWIDEQQEGDTPYTFKLVLTPLPNKNISISDEEQSLQSQGFTPSATLILIPVHGYTSAYGDGASSGIVSRVATGGYGLVSSGVGLVTGVLGSFLGGGTAPPAQAAQERPIERETADTNPAADLSTLRERERGDQQFYNGNALNFEPRKDDDKKED